MECIHELEAGRVVLAPGRFILTGPERRFLSPQWSRAGAKNISLRPGAQVARGANGNAGELAALGAMMARYADTAQAWLEHLVPAYRGQLIRGNTSYRPAPIAEASRSWSSDDRRLHVDSFASNPVHGKRILRVFTNVGEESRVWRTGEPFEAFARRFFPRVKPPVPGAATLLASLGVTKRRRSAYDHYMLGMHDAAKADADYQRDAPREEVAFAPGSTWIVFTDQVVHAAIAGQFAFEQTFYLDCASMREPARAPLAVLERMAGRALVKRATPRPRTASPA